MIKTNNSLLFTFARRYAWQQKQKNLIYKLSRLTCYSIALGTAILLLVLFSLNGMEKWLSSLFYKHTPTLTIASQKGKTFLSNPKLKNTLKQLPQILTIVEILEEPCLVRLNKKQTIATIKGVSANYTQSDFFKEHPLLQTAFLHSTTTPYQAIIDNQLCHALALNIETSSTVVEVLYPKLNPIHTNWTKPYHKSTLKIIDVFALKSASHEKSIIVPIHFLENLTHSYGKRSSWEITLTNNPTNLKAIQHQIQQHLPEGLTVSNQYEQNCARKKAIAIERLSVYCIFVLVLFLALLHLLLMLCMLVLEKKNTIKTLYILGMKPHQIGYIFLYSGILITLEGIIYGTILAYILGLLQQNVGLITLHNIHGETIIYPIEMHAKEFLHTIILTMILGTLTGIWPALQAKKLAKTTHFTTFYS